jgi:hypothetical protein
MSDESKNEPAMLNGLKSGLALALESDSYDYKLKAYYRINDAPAATVGPPTIREAITKAIAELSAIKQPTVRFMTVMEMHEAGLICLLCNRRLIGGAPIPAGWTKDQFHRSGHRIKHARKA